MGHSSQTLPRTGSSGHTPAAAYKVSSSFEGLWHSLHVTSVAWDSSFQLPAKPQALGTAAAVTLWVSPRTLRVASLSLLGFRLSVVHYPWVFYVHRGRQGHVGFAQFGS